MPGPEGPNQLVIVEAKSNAGKDHFDDWQQKIAELYIEMVQNHHCTTDA